MSAEDRGTSHVTFRFKGIDVGLTWFSGRGRDEHLNTNYIFSFSLLAQIIHPHPHVVKH